MIRNRILAIAAALGLLGGLALLAAPGSAGPIAPGPSGPGQPDIIAVLVGIDGNYPHVGPVGSGLTDVFLTGGTATSPQVPAFAFGVSDLQLISGPDMTVQIGSPTAGPHTLTLADPNMPADMAVFDFPTNGSDWHHGSNQTIDARVFLASNTFPELNFSAFLAPEGGVFALTTTGVTVNADNTVTVAPGATASFSLTAVPEPASAVLMLGAGAAALVGLGLSRLRRRPGG
jgi:hypothetical protein